jgi:hypothetical protein
MVTVADLIKDLAAAEEEVLVALDKHDYVSLSKSSDKANAIMQKIWAFAYGNDKAAISFLKLRGLIQ